MNYCYSQGGGDPKPWYFRSVKRPRTGCTFAVFLKKKKRVNNSGKTFVGFNTFRLNGTFAHQTYVLRWFESSFAFGTRLRVIDSPVDWKRNSPVTLPVSSIKMYRVTIIIQQRTHDFLLGGGESGRDVRKKKFGVLVELRDSCYSLNHVHLCDVHLSG